MGCAREWLCSCLGSTCYVGMNWLALFAHKPLVNRLCAGNLCRGYSLPSTYNIAALGPYLGHWSSPWDGQWLQTLTRKLVYASSMWRFSGRDPTLSPHSWSVLWWWGEAQLPRAQQVRPGYFVCVASCDRVHKPHTGLRQPCPSSLAEHVAN